RGGDPTLPRRGDHPGPPGRLQVTAIVIPTSTGVPAAASGFADAARRPGRRPGSRSGQPPASSVSASFAPAASSIGADSCAVFGSSSAAAGCTCASLSLLLQISLVIAQALFAGKSSATSSTFGTTMVSTSLSRLYVAAGMVPSA